MLSIYVTQKKSKKLRSFKSFSVRVLQNLKKKKRKEKLHLILKKCLEISDREVSLALAPFSAMSVPPGTQVATPLGVLFI